MPTLTIELPQHQAQTADNLRRWAELLSDAELARIEGRIETDRHGHIREKMALYFDAGAREVWRCAESGVLRFFGPGTAQSMSASDLCPQFPKQIELR